MPELSVIIPARKEFYLSRTVDSIFEAMRGDTEVIAVIDGESAGPELLERPGLRIIRHTKPEGQRQSINEAARISKAKYICKTDAHSMFDEGFDVKLMADCEYDWTVIPRMYNLHAYDLVCRECGWRGDNWRWLEKCPQCARPKTLREEHIWKPKKRKRTDWMYFRAPYAEQLPLRVQYYGNKDWVCVKCGFHHETRGDHEKCQRCKGNTFRKELAFPTEYAKHREWAKLQPEIADVMTGQGACWFMHRDRFWDLGGLDEGHGSWGQMGVEVACKAWLSGGRQVVNRKTWFSHFFRCGNGPHFPYQASGKAQQRARKYSIKFWTSNQWSLQKRPLEWLVERFWPVPTWKKPETVPELRDVTKTSRAAATSRTRSDTWSRWPPTLAEWQRNGLDPKDIPIELSVLIPARNEKFLQQTIDDLVSKLTVGYEILVGLDAYDPDPPLVPHDRVRVIKSEQRIGMRPMINKLAAEAHGQLLLKVDAHCMIGERFDREMIAAHEPGCVIVATRYDLDTKRWRRRDPSRNDCRRLTHRSEDQIGLRALAWPEYEEAHATEEVSETMACSGSCYLVERALFERWGGLDEEHGTFGQEGCELACKVWLGGGRMLLTKKTWYAHWNRGKSTYSLGASEKPRSIARSHDLWPGDNWPQAKYSFQWLLEKFQPPGWPLPAKPERLPAIRQGAACKGWHCDVDRLWELRDGISEPPKRWRLAIFWKAFDQFVDQVLLGEPDWRGAYYWYLASHLSRKPVVAPTAKQIAHLDQKQQDARRLIESIRDEALKAPLEFYAQDGHLILWKGYRRLVILHRLGMKDVPCRILMDREAAGNLSPPQKLVRLRPATETRIHDLAAEQFRRWGRNATDKYWVHGYTRYYDTHFAAIRPRAKRILEIGVLRGASLALWREYFVHAHLYGVDIHPSRWKRYAGDLRDCRVFVGDETDRDFMLGLHGRGPFDVIIDDASHEPDVQRQTFEMMWPAVRPYGWYVIEDTYRSYDGRDKGCCLPLRIEHRIHGERDVQQIHRYYNIIFLQKTGHR